MIVTVISDSSKTERVQIVFAAKTHAAYYTEDYWEFIESATTEELQGVLASADKLDMAFLDLTMNGALKTAEQIRSEYGESYLVLIADSTMSPVDYIRPSIRAESLMLKPLAKEQLTDVVREAVQVYARRISAPDKSKVFVAESNGERNLIPYDKILFFESREKKLFLSTENEEYGFYGTLDDLETRLEGSFLRCHRSYIVNSGRIARVEISGSRVVLDDGTEIPLSRSYKQTMREFLKEKDGTHC